MKPLFFIQFYPTIRCNQNCNFCFNNYSIKKQYQEIRKNDAFKIIDIACQNGIKEIDILGGEPLLVDWIDEFVKTASESGLLVNISTNGSLHNRLKKLLKIPSDTINIGFSLLGLKQTHNRLTGSNNYELIIENIKFIKSSNINPIVKTVLMKSNKKEIINLLNFLFEIGLKKYFLLHEDIIGRKRYDCISFPEYHDFYLELSEKYTGNIDIGSVSASGFYKYNASSGKRCDAGFSKIAIMPDGSVFPCNLLASFKEFKLGNIFKDSLQSILEHPSLNYFRNKNFANPCEKKDCKHYNNCTGGCPAHSYFFYGKLDIIDPRCNNLLKKINNTIQL
ncbi:MAG: radical SAM protein [Nitrospirae bacterium]|jgi:radical SAM protein with 4Fe4S-binding SPASM domain|nr:radical SAM protein [Nitrospirota bacterium]